MRSIRMVKKGPRRKVRLSQMSRWRVKSKRWSSRHHHKMEDRMHSLLRKTRMKVRWLSL